MKFFEKKNEKKFRFGKKKFGSDTETFGRYRIPIPKFDRTLVLYLKKDKTGDYLKVPGLRFKFFAISEWIYSYYILD